MDLKMRIKDIINEGNIFALYETQKVIDNVEIWAKNVVDEIVKNYKTAPRYNFVVLPNNKIFYIEWVNIKIGNFNLTSHKYETTADFDIHVFICKTNEEIEILSENGFLNSRFVPYIGSKEIYIGFEYFNGKYDRKRLESDIAHEITHYIQRANNRSLLTDKDIEEYNKQYNRITKSYLEQNDGILRNFSAICYYFTKSEISAKLNGLYTELMNNDIKYKNQVEVYKITSFYDEYSYILGLYENIKNASDDEWTAFRELAQHGEFYKPNLTLASTSTNYKFKKDFVNFTDRMIEYTNKGINVVIKKALIANKNEKI
jgi:hypothetical protein